MRTRRTKRVGRESWATGCRRREGKNGERERGREGGEEPSSTTRLRSELGIEDRGIRSLTVATSNSIWRRGQKAGLGKEDEVASVQSSSDTASENEATAEAMRSSSSGEEMWLQNGSGNGSGQSRGGFTLRAWLGCRELVAEVGEAVAGGGIGSCATRCFGARKLMR